MGSLEHNDNGVARMQDLWEGGRADDAARKTLQEVNMLSVEPAQQGSTLGVSTRARSACREAA
jgi:hypothetical protein